MSSMTNNNILPNLFTDCFVTVRIESEKHDVFGAVIANFFKLLAEHGQLLEWTTDEEPWKRVHTTVPSLHLSSVLPDRLDIQ